MNALIQNQYANRNNIVFKQINDIKKWPVPWKPLLLLITYIFFSGCIPNSRKFHGWHIQVTCLSTDIDLIIVNGKQVPQHFIWTISLHKLKITYLLRPWNLSKNIFLHVGNRLILFVLLECEFRQSTLYIVIFRGLAPPSFWLSIILLHFISLYGSLGSQYSHYIHLRPFTIFAFLFSTTSKGSSTAVLNLTLKLFSLHQNHAFKHQIF